MNLFCTVIDMSERREKSLWILSQINNFALRLHAFQRHNATNACT